MCFFSCLVAIRDDSNWMGWAPLTCSTYPTRIPSISLETSLFYSWELLFPIDPQKWCPQKYWKYRFLMFYILDSMSKIEKKHDSCCMFSGSITLLKWHPPFVEVMSHEKSTKYAIYLSITNMVGFIIFDSWFLLVKSPKPQLLTMIAWFVGLSKDCFVAWLGHPQGRRAIPTITSRRCPVIAWSWRRKRRSGDGLSEGRNLGILTEIGEFKAQTVSKVGI